MGRRLTPGTVVRFKRDGVGFAKGDLGSVVAVLGDGEHGKVWHKVLPSDTGASVVIAVHDTDFDVAPDVPRAELTVRPLARRPNDSGAEVQFVHDGVGYRQGQAGTTMAYLGRGDDQHVYRVRVETGREVIADWPSDFV